ncbi:MAG: phosphoglucosamine mutase [Candidatus Hadarchaeota archaeon]
MSSLFGTSGVRGVLNESIDPEVALKIASSFGSEIGSSKTVMIGRDARTSGRMLENSIVSGLQSVGCNACTLGIVPTPVLGFSVGQSNVSGGIMITASHNPPEYNGLKLFDSTGKAISPGEERTVEKRYFKGRLSRCEWGEIGNIQRRDPIDGYLELVGKMVNLNDKFRVIVDCSNGPSSLTTPKLLRSLGCEVFTVNSQLDGYFPGRPPEPIEENLKHLEGLIRSMNADLALAHDGDGDRIAALDDKGRFVPQDKLLALMAGYYADKEQTDVVTTVNASRVIEDMVTDVGRTVIRTKVGDVSVAEEMIGENLYFGGEPSGTWILGDIHMCPDGTIAGIKILEMLGYYSKKMSELVDTVREYPIVREKVSCPDDEKKKKMRDVKSNVRNVFNNVRDLSETDGIRLELEDGSWVLVRPSGTEPYIRITAEAETSQKAKDMVSKTRAIFGG